MYTQKRVSAGRKIKVYFTPMLALNLENLISGRGLVKTSAVLSSVRT